MEPDRPTTPTAPERGTAPCTLACPAGIDVPRYIRHVRNGDFGGALRVIRERIPFPGVCGHACVHPCEAKCARIQYDEPVAIRLLKRAAEEKGRDKGAPAEKATPTGKRVAIVGSGPCGLTAAYYLTLFGHDATVLEALPVAGGMLRHGIPGYRLPEGVVDREIEAIRSCGVRIRTGVRVASAPELLCQGFDAVLMACGAWKSLKIGVEGEDSPRVLDGLRFLREVNAGRRPRIGSAAVVVGGGNTAVDAARSCLRLGARTLLVYRRSRKDMPALAEEISDAEAEGLQFRFWTTPVRIAEGSVICLKTAPGPADETGRSRPVPVEGSEFSQSCDAVIVAVGQVPDAGTFQLETRAGGTLRVDGMLATSVRGVFAAGDAVSGPKTIIDAIAQGRMASVSMDRFLGGKGRLLPGGPSESPPAPPRAKPMVVPRQPCEKAPAKARILGFGLVESGYPEAAAIQEASRCLACDLRQYLPEVDPNLCKGCGYCREICRLDVFSVSDRFNAAGYKPFAATHPERCVGCLKCVYVCPDLAITLTDGSGG